MEYNYHEFNVKNLSEPESIVDLKPKGTIIFLSILGLVMLATLNWKFMLFGGFILINTIIAFISVKNRPILAFYEQGVLLYDKQTAQPDAFIPWERLSRWQYKTGVAFQDQIMLYTIDEQLFLSESFRGAKIFKFFNKYAKDKEQTVQLLRK